MAGCPRASRNRQISAFDHFRAMAQRVEVDTGEVRIMGSKSNLLQTLAALAGTGTKLGTVPSLVPKWCARQESNL
jgi:site-specific DNA recombinase